MGLDISSVTAGISISWAFEHKAEFFVERIQYLPHLRTLEWIPSLSLHVLVRRNNWQLFWKDGTVALGNN